MSLGSITGNIILFAVALPALHFSTAKLSSSMYVVRGTIENLAVQMLHCVDERRNCFHSSRLQHVEAFFFKYTESIWGSVSGSFFFTASANYAIQHPNFELNGNDYYRDDCQENDRACKQR